MIFGLTALISLSAMDINAFVKEIQDKPLDQDIRALVNDLTSNESCCHSASTTKTFTSAFLPSSSHDAHEAKDSGKTSQHPAITAPPVLIFMSYSIPKNIWQALQSEAQHLGIMIQFVIRGLPENSFQQLAQKVTAYNCPVIIDPTLFRDYNITAVPAFVFRERDHVRGTYGNISIAYARVEAKSLTPHNEVASIRDRAIATSQTRKTGAPS